MKKFIKRIINIVNAFNRFDNKFQITKNSSSLSFYILLSLVSVFLIIFQILSSTIGLDTFFFARLIDIFSKKFSDQIEAIMPSFSLSGFSLLLLINILYSASKTIHGYNRIADYIYFEIKNRVGWRSRLSAMLMFAMLMFVFIFEISLLIFSNYFINNVFKLNRFIVKFIQMILELGIIYLTINILYLYAPPRKMKFKETYKGSLFATGFIYIIVSLFVLIVTALNTFNIGYSLLTIISFSLLILFYINYILIVGLIINYYGNIKQLKISLFSK